MPSTLVSLLCCSMLMLRHGWQWQRHSTPGGCAMLLCRLYIFRLTPLSRLFSRTVFSSSSVLYFKRRGRGGWSGMGEIFGVVVVGCVLLPFAWAAEQHREWVERDESWVGEEMKEEKKVEGGFCEWARECERFFFWEKEKRYIWLNCTEPVTFFFGQTHYTLAMWKRHFSNKHRAKMWRGKGISSLAASGDERRGLNFTQI